MTRPSSEASRRRRVLWVVPVSDLAGVARHVIDVAGHGVPGYELEVLAPPGPLAERLGDAGAVVHVVPFGPEAGLWRSIRSVRGVVGRRRPAIVHTHLSYADLAATIALGLGRTRLVTTEHGIAGDDLVYHGSRWRSRLMAAVHAARLRRCQRVIAVSDATRSAMSDKWHVAARRVDVIRNGLDDRPQTVRQAGERVLSLARLAPEKRIDSLVDAFAGVHRARPTASLVIAGEGSLRQALVGRVRDAGLADCVAFAGHVEPALALAQADVLVQLSLWENCSYSILDAIAAGCGVVATSVGGNPEILPPECLVALDAPADHVARRVIEQAEQVARRPARPAGWPSVDQMCQQIGRVYATLMG